MKKKFLLFISCLLLCGTLCFSLDITEVLKANIGSEISGLIYKNPGIGSYPHGTILEVEDGWVVTKNGKYISYIKIDEIAAISFTNDATRK